MDVASATRRVLLGESIASLAASYRQAMLAAVGLTDEEASPATFHKEAVRFAGKVCRHLAERSAHDAHVQAALIEWAQQVEDYDAFDALLTAYPAFDGRAALLRRGRTLFPGTLTAHWEEA
jgi:hypothetical protein